MVVFHAMKQSLKLDLPSKLRRDVTRAAKEVGVSEDDYIRQAVADRLLLDAFEKLRAKLVPQAQSAGIYTDEDVFKQFPS
jgi:hypothetical protein